MRLFRWTYLGTGIWRWLLVLATSGALIGLGAIYLLRSLSFRFPDWLATPTLRFLPGEVRGTILLLAGCGLTAIVWMHLHHTIRELFEPHRSAKLIDQRFQRWLLQRGPRVVAIGGGTGLSVLLAGLKHHTANLSAIVTVADDGGSSGRLRRDLHIPPPGDFRQCIVALADIQPLMGALLQYRFPHGSELQGHNLGNLMMAAMADISGNFELGLRDLSHVLAVQGQILPSTLEEVTLVGELRDQTRVRGESRLHVDHASAASDLAGQSQVDHVSLDPADPAAYPEAVQAIRSADLVVVGPGSLFTSVLPNLLVKDIARALAASSAYKVFVCNVATERGETDQYTAEDFLRAVERHVDGPLFDAVITNTRTDARQPAQWESEVVPPTWQATHGVEVVSLDVVDRHNAHRHDPTKLAQAVMTTWHRAQGQRALVRRAGNRWFPVRLGSPRSAVAHRSGRCASDSVSG